MIVRTRAPGKLLLTGAYAVLEGAPALVVAVDRFAVAHAEAPLPGRPNPDGTPHEIAVAFPDGGAPRVDTRALYMQDKGADATKLGLGSSAAALVAALAAHDLARGIAIDHPSIFRRAKEIHQRAQGGGSGVDVASSTFGGTLRYQEGTPTAAKLPEGLVLEVWWSGLAARTSTFLSAVRAFAASAPANYKCIMHALVEASERAADPSTGLAAFLEAARAFSQGLADLGTSAAVPIVPGSFAALSAQAVLEGGAFFGSGAGGGDVAIFLGSSPSSPRFAALAAEHHVLRVPLGIADGGVASY